MLKPDTIEPAVIRLALDDLEYQLLVLLKDVWYRIDSEWHLSRVIKGKGKGVLKEDLKGPEICKDPAVLTTHAMGVNIYKTGPEVKLKDDSEYPEWLFQIDLGPLKTLQDLNPEMPKYWKLLRKMHMWRNNRLAKNKKF